MPRHRLFTPVTPRGVCLVMLGFAALWSAPAMAQVAPNPDPLSPWLQTDPRNPPRFQKFTRPAQAPLSTRSTFAPIPSGAGLTGFDATNARKKAKPAAKARPASDALAQASAAPAPAPVSPYLLPPPAPVNGMRAEAPAAPPVELGPIRKKPTKRRAHDEGEDPYAPLGVTAGAFTLFPAIELIGGYDTNPARGQGGSSATLYTVAPELLAQSNWSRHELKAELRGSYTGYSPDETPTLSRPYFNGKVDGRVDVTDQTRIDLGTRVLVSTDNPGSPNLQAGLDKLPVFATYGGSAGLGQKFNRLDVEIKGDIARTVYQDSKLTDGSTASNEDRQYNQYGGTLRAGYELIPGVTPYVEVGADTRRHDLAADVSGYLRNSKGYTAVVGSTFKLTNLLTGDIGIGYGTREYDDPRLARLSGLIGNGSLTWSADALTTVKLTAQSTISESTIAGVSGVFSRDVGLQVDHSLRRWLIASFKAGVGQDRYEGSVVDILTTPLCDCVVSEPGGTAADRIDWRYMLGAGLTYKFNRSFQIKGEFRQEWLRSNVGGNDYSASVFMLGVRFQR